MDNDRRILVTSALPYANGPLHLGHIAGAYLPADIYVRFQKMNENEVVYICGTDEHGVPITITAERENTTPQAVVDKYHEMHKESFYKFGIHFNNFSRTSLPIHHKISQDFFLNLYDKELLVRKEVRQFFCNECNRFLPDRYLEGDCYHCGSPGAKGDQCEVCGKWLEQLKLKNPICKICGSTPEIKDTFHWFLPLGKFQKQIEEWIISKKGWRDNVTNFCKGWFKEGLDDRPVTRDLTWGIKVPVEGAEDKVLYVWFEAPIGYISSTAEWSRMNNDPEGWKRYWCDPKTEIYHFIGKDNIVFHAIVFPIVLLAYGGYNLPENVIANEFLNIEGDKLSTSRNYAVWLDECLEKFEPDPLRYYLTSIAPETKDSDFSWREFQQRNDSELAGILGNFFNRTFAFVQRYFNNKIPEPGSFNNDDCKMFDKMGKAYKKTAGFLAAFKFRDSARAVLNLARSANKYFNDEEPWITIKQDPERCATSIYVCLELVRNINILMAPFMPFKTLEVLKILFSEVDLEKYDKSNYGLVEKLFNKKLPLYFQYEYNENERLKPGKELGNIKIIFPKLDEKIVKSEAEKLAKIRREFSEEDFKKEEKEQMSEIISIEDFQKIDLKVAIIKTVEKVAGADKLYKMIVDLGDEDRQIVTGIADYYGPEELVGMRILVITNLKPAKIRGEVSNGMLLAALNKDDLVLVTTDKDIPPGSSVS